ncbi:LPS export ABC transporter permease LptG [Zeimonas arvi]|uniref:LPS export ABC transporter permease LptG n=1 Tax=Zeimonas arvi TaxID=2498847 RepID=A0A5C8P3Y8_9BURK|nr:LPS export ABC transporter permease LptG [Zeimonas arvi]TXL68376.1 LPS export ABC transporter permease LptG [Zeimonas arvi]
MLLVGRYLRREIVVAVAFVLVGFLALFAFFDLINELEDVGRGGYRLQHAVAFVLLGLPSHVYELMPIAALIGSIYALSQLASHSEYTAMRAAGLGRRRALGAVARVGLALAVLTALVGEVLSPPAERLGQQLRLSAIGGSVTGQFRSGLWVKDTARDQAGEVNLMRFVNIGELLPDGTLRDVRIFEFDAQMRLSRLLEARGASWGRGNGWELREVEEIRFTDVPAAGLAPAVGTRRATAPTLHWQTELRPEILGVLLVEPDRMSGLNLYSYIRHLRENAQNTSQYEIAFWKKIVYPLAVIVMMALALPFAYLQVRAGGTGYKVFAGIMLGIAFHFMNGLFSHLGLLNTWPPLLSVSIPSVVAFMLALGMLAWVDRAR